MCCGGLSAKTWNLEGGQNSGSQCSHPQRSVALFHSNAPTTRHPSRLGQNVTEQRIASSRRRRPICSVHSFSSSLTLVTFSNLPSPDPLVPQRYPITGTPVVRDIPSILTLQCGLSRSHFTHCLVFDRLFARSPTIPRFAASVTSTSLWKHVLRVVTSLFRTRSFENIDRGPSPDSTNNPHHSH